MSVIFKCMYVYVHMCTVIDFFHLTFQCLCVYVSVRKCEGVP